MNIALTTFTHPAAGSSTIKGWQSAAKKADLGHHRLTPQAEADCVLFVDLHLSEDLLLSSLFRNSDFLAAGSKALVYDERDEPWSGVPGIYVSMPASLFDSNRQRAFGYWTYSSNTVSDRRAKPDLLFSFVGTPGHVTSGGNRLRKAILAIKHGRAFIKDSTGFVFYDDRGDPGSHLAHQRYFAATISRSKFVLCPRGQGTSSIRMYEVLRGGRVPVVLADEWVPPSGPDWDSCTIRVRERDTSKIHSIIEGTESRWPEMSEAAFATFEKWFSRKRNIPNIFDLCEDILRTSTLTPQPRWSNSSYRLTLARKSKRNVRAFLAKTLRGAGLLK